jgi:hypothetical protein
LSKINHSSFSFHLPSAGSFRIIATLPKPVQMVKLTLIDLNLSLSLFLLRMIPLLNLPRKHALLFFFPNPLLLYTALVTRHAEIIFVFFILAAVGLLSLQNQYALMSPR